MKILAFSWKDPAHPAAGGSEVFLHEVARTWVGGGHQVDLFCAGAPGLAAADTSDGVRIIRRGGRFSVYAEARRFYRQEGRGRYDIVLDVVNTRPFLCPRFVDNVPVVALIHQLAKEIWFYEVPLPAAVVGRYWLEPRWLRAYATVPTLTVSTSSADSLREYGLTDVTIVPEGMTPRITAAMPPREVAPTMLFVGRLARNKRPDHAIEAFRYVSERLPDARLWVVGTGPMEAQLRRSAPAGTTFFGRVDAATKEDLLARANVLVVTSVREGWGLVVNEAAAAGTFVLGYDVPGLCDSVTAVGGGLTRPHPAAMGVRLVEVLQDESRRRLSAPGTLPGWSHVAAVVLGRMEAALSSV